MEVVFLSMKTQNDIDYVVQLEIFNSYSFSKLIKKYHKI